MSAKLSGPENRALAAELEQIGRDEEGRRVARSIWADDMKKAEREAQKARGLRAQIEATRQNGREDNGERLRELGKEHHELTGACGRSV